MKKAGWLLLLLLTVVSYADAQRFLVRFKNKGTSPYSFSNPTQYLSQRAIDRRKQYSIAIDSTDLPITPRYLDSIRSVPGVTLLNVSRWLNQVSILVTDANALNKINGFTFVKSSNKIASRLRSSTDMIDDKNYVQAQSSPSVMRVQNVSANYYNYGSSFNQIHIHNGEFLHNIGLRGQGMIIGMLDAGYFNYTSLKAFDSMNTNNQVLGTWDFVNNEASVVEDYFHGMYCLSTIAANIPGQFVGSAPKANFYLFKTEDINSEYPIEEHNWVSGAERIDSAGGNVISSSVGYFSFDDPTFSHTYADLNGDITIAAIGADLAAKKGLIVVNAAGNSGNDPVATHYIMTPADADSVIAVGAVDANGQVASFSSYGPSSDGQVKPDVASVGANTTVQGTNNAITTSNGTSYACPNLAGLITCLWQGFTELNNMKVVNAIRQAGSIASAPNTRIGFGIPDVKKAMLLLLKEFAVSNVEVNNCKATLSWTSKDISTMKYEIERKAFNENAFNKIGEKAAKGSVFSTQQYTFTDNNVASKSLSYRIRQVIDTANATFAADYIDTATIQVTASCSSNKNKKIKVTPNPASSSISLQVGIVDPINKLSIRIVNMQGNTVAVVKKIKPEGETNFEIPVYFLPAGKYFISVYNDNALIETTEFVKL